MGAVSIALRIVFFSVFFTAVPLLVRAAPPDLVGIPDTETLRGDAFIEAWLVLRQDLDSLAHMDIHPALLDRWTDEMPKFLARDMANLATEPGISLALAARLRDASQDLEAMNALDRRHVKLKAVFPHHYAALRLRLRLAHRYDAVDGLYDVWTEAIDDALRHGARNSPMFLSMIREAIPRVGTGRVGTGRTGTGDSAEVKRRNLQSLIDFWSRVDRRIANTGAQPTWPTTFSEAMVRIQSHDKSPHAKEKRVSAAISLCSTLGPILGYDSFPRPHKSTTALTPGGGRAIDQNLATSFPVRKGDALVLLVPGDRGPIGIHIASFCPGETGSRIKSLLFRGESRGQTWQQTSTLNQSTRFFQTIRFDQRATNRIALEVTSIEGGDTACIAEIRLFFE